MKRLWIRIRLPLAVVALLVVTLAMARLFSGPEDTWIKNEQGEWIRHGYPSGPPPAQDYSEPVTYMVIPIFFLAAFAVPLFFLRFHKLHNRLNFDTASRDIKFFGYVSTALFLMGILTGAGLITEICMSGGGGDVSLLEFLVILSIGGFAGMCVILGALFFLLKRNCNDHYILEKSRREMLEILENFSSR